MHIIFIKKINDRSSFFFAYYCYYLEYHIISIHPFGHPFSPAPSLMLTQLSWKFEILPLPIAATQTLKIFTLHDELFNYPLTIALQTLEIQVWNNLALWLGCCWKSLNTTWSIQLWSCNCCSELCSFFPELLASEISCNLLEGCLISLSYHYTRNLFPFQRI